MVKRPVVIACIGYILGIILGLYFKSIALFFICALIIVVLSLCINKKVKRYVKVLCPKKAIYILVVFIILGCIHIQVLNKKYNKIYKIKNVVEITGVVEEAEVKEYSNKYILKIKSINNKKCINIKLILYTEKDEKTLEYGDYIRIKANYSKPEDSRNYKGFSYKNYLKQNSIYGTIEPIQEIQIIETDKINLISKVANNIRKTLISEANRNLSKQASAVFLGIVLGDKTEISDEINTYFREGNMAHILAVSGAHVSYIILTLNIILGKTNKRIYLISTIIMLIFFMILTGFSPSVVRACVMAIIATVAKLIHRKSDIYTNLGLSALVILLINPYTILNIGFELTYLGTIGIVLLSKRITTFWEYIFKNKEHKHSKLRVKNVIQDKLKKTIINLIIISLSVQILIAPIILTNFNTISYNFLISGVISTPIFAAIMIVGILCLVLVPFRNICFLILEVLINSLIFISKFISNIPFSKIMLPTPNIVWIIGYYAIFIIVLLLKHQTVLRVIKNKIDINKFLKRIIAVILIICIIFQCFQSFKCRDLQIYFIDVGQGDSSLIVTPKNKRILIDGGGDADYDIGKNILVPYLLDMGISYIDYMMISHFDNDHCGGLKYVIEKLKVNNLLISKQSEISNEYKEIMQLAKERNINTILVKQGDTIVIEKDIQLKILYPTAQLEFDDLNNNSIVAKLVYKNFSMLFTGDIGLEAEKQLLGIYDSNILKNTVLKVGHHGSKTSSGEAFIKAVKPRIALIGVEKDNNFGHPNREVIDRLNTVRCNNL